MGKDESSRTSSRTNHRRHSREDEYSMKPSSRHSSHRSHSKSPSRDRSPDHVHHARSHREHGHHHHHHRSERDGETRESRKRHSSRSSPESSVLPLDVDHRHREATRTRTKSRRGEHSRSHSPVNTDSSQISRSTLKKDSIKADPAFPHHQNGISNEETQLLSNRTSSWRSLNESKATSNLSHGLEEKVNMEEDNSMLMAAILGFSNFETTKGKHVPGADVSAADIKKKMNYRQYMNRKGGFNKPLSQAE